MANIKNYNFNRLDFRLSDSDYYDFYLNDDGISTSESGTTDYSIASFNFSAFTASTIIVSSTEWNESVVSGLTATTYGLTGLDNGDINYDKGADNFSHTALLSHLTGSTLTHTSGDTKLTLHSVSGYTTGYTYPINLVIETGATGNYVNLCGGFYQGYYKLDGYPYQVLPDRYEKGWTIASWLRKSDSICSGVTATTLNDTYSDNKGFFFYIGTRAENKFWNVFSGNTAECTSGSSEFCMNVKETEITIDNITVAGSATTFSIPLSPPPVDIELITNQFLIFGRSEGLLCSDEPSPDGYGQIWASEYNPPYYSSVVRKEQTDFRNQFLIFGRSEGLLCSDEPSPDGYGQIWASEYSGSSSPILELNTDDAIIDNALGFRIKDDGSIGYRLLTVSADCKSIEVIEEYSISGMVTSDQWEHITVKWINNDYYEGCDLINQGPRRGKLKFYVNSNLIFVSQELDEFIAKRLDDLIEKQIGVPYNISVGGGTQGLLESMTFDGQDPNDLGMVIETNFAGTFIGSMSTFELFQKNLSWCEIKDIYNSRRVNYI
jgi:hypothetical protein